MRDIPQIPADYSYQVMVLLREDGRVLFEYGESDLCEFLGRYKYQRDYGYRDTLALAEKHNHCIGFSHWSRPSGAVGTWADAPVWRWEDRFTIIKRYKVGRKGKVSAIAAPKGEQR